MCDVSAVEDVLSNRESLIGPPSEERVSSLHQREKGRLYFVERVFLSFVWGGE